MLGIATKLSLDTSFIRIICTCIGWSGVCQLGIVAKLSLGTSFIRIIYMCKGGVEGVS